MDLPDALLGVLKCCICKGYLSCGPIYIVDGGKATCGRCNEKTNGNLPESENNLVSKTRNIQYENLASIFQFPCRFALHGCPEKLRFSEEPACPHEQSCKYEPYDCPISPDNQCDWCGPWHQLLEHCEQAHPDNILENPYSSEPNFAEDSIKTYIIPCFNTLFLLCVNISLRSERVIYSMYLLDDPSKLKLYSFSVDVKRNHLSFSKPGKIGTADDFIKRNPIFCIINRNILFLNVGGVAGSTFNIDIKHISRVIKCKFCPLKVENYEAVEWICNDCKSELHYCKNKSMNCTFKDVKIEKVKKHERYFCKYINECFDCNGPVTLGKLFQHFDSSAHANTICSREKLTWQATETPKRTLNYVLLKSSTIDRMLCKYYLDARQLSLVLCAPHSSDQLSLYKCAIEVHDKETKFQKTFQTVFVENCFWDWRIDIDFDLERYEAVGLDITVYFEKF